MKLRYDMLDLEHLKSKIIKHPMCDMFEETGYTFTVIFPERIRKNNGVGLKVSRALGDI